MKRSIYAAATIGPAILTLCLSTVLTADLFAATEMSGLDTDGDGVPDSADNCSQVANADQRDTDNDGFGNRCDPDFDNSGLVNFTDLSYMKSVFFSSDGDGDLDGSGLVNFTDLSIMKAFFFGPPGPGAVAGPVVCGTLPPVYTRINHFQGNIDLTRVSWAPDGSYALVLGYNGYLFRYDNFTQAFDPIASSGEYWNAVVFSEDGSYALIVGQDNLSTPSPVMYRYTEGAGLVQVADIIGVGSGKLADPARISDISQKPDTNTFAILTDNGVSGVGQISYLNLFEPDWVGGAHVWSYEGGLNTSQGSSSIDWGTTLGNPMALSVSRYLELMWFEPMLPSGNFHHEVDPPAHGNLKKVIFDPKDSSLAWVMQWSGQGRIFSWQNGLQNDDAYSFSGWSMYDFSVSPHGAWKIFVGRNGNVWLSDSPFRPIDNTRFYNHGIPDWSGTPWFGGTSDFLLEAAFHPIDGCTGLIVGDATSNQGMILTFDAN